MVNTLETDRLSLHPLELSEAGFIFELVNSAGWIRFIGDRKILNIDYAKEYIKNIQNNPSIMYWVVKLKETGPSIGIITFIKREYLDHQDIGFAFLPAAEKKGYAYEAARAVLDHVTKDSISAPVLATAAADNVSSVSLLERLGFEFSREIVVEGKKLLLYRVVIVANKDYI